VARGSAKRDRAAEGYRIAQRSMLGTPISLYQKPQSMFLFRSMVGPDYKAIYK